MSSKKYLSDYRIEETTDTKGRIRSEAVYIGGDYILSPPVSTGEKRLIICLSVLTWLAFIGALIPVTNAARLTHVMLPFVFSALSMYFVTGSAATLLSVKEIMIREKAEKIAKRLPPSSIITAILSLASLIALLVTAIISWDSIAASDIIFAVLVLVISLSSATIFYKCRKLKAKKVEPPESD